MTTILIDQAEKELAALLSRAQAGEDIVISDRAGAGVRLVPVEAQKSYRGRGALRGVIEVSDADLFDPLPEEEIERWQGGAEK